MSEAYVKGIMGAIDSFIPDPAPAENMWDYCRSQRGEDGTAVVEYHMGHLEVPTWSSHSSRWWVRSEWYYNFYPREEMRVRVWVGAPFVTTLARQSYDIYKDGPYTQEEMITGMARGTLREAARAVSCLMLDLFGLLMSDIVKMQEQKEAERGVR